MATTNPDNNSPGADAGADSSSPDADLDQLQSLAQQLQSEVSHFTQNAETAQETYATVIQQLAAQSMAGDRQLKKFQDQLDLLASQFRNSRH